MHEMSTCATRIVNMVLKHGMAPVASIACEFLALGYIHMYKKYAAAEVKRLLTIACHDD